MLNNDNLLRCCTDCGKQINFKDLCQNNPSLKLNAAKELYYNPIISIYCHGCFFERPEKPFKLRRRDLTYYSKRLRV